MTMATTKLISMDNYLLYRILMMSNDAVSALGDCQIYFSLMGSDFDQEGKNNICYMKIIACLV